MSNSAWSKLMALSRAQTEEAQSSVQSVLIQRQQKEDLRRKQQEEKERKERELETKLRLKHFEEVKKQEELKARREQEIEAKERERKRREEKERDALRYGPKKSRSIGSGSLKYPSSNSDSRRGRLQACDDDDGPAPMALTREEKRKRKEENALRRGLALGKRSSHASGRRTAARLPGGAVNIASPGPGSLDSGAHQSVKARIAAMPNGLTKLNINKRDTRTIDEILQDRAKARETKILDGEEAKEFNDWFGGKKKDVPKPPLPPASASASSDWSTPVIRPSASKSTSNVESSMKKLTLSKSAVSDSAKGTSVPKPKTSAAPKQKSSLAKSMPSKDKTSIDIRSSASSRKRTRSPPSHDYDSEDTLSPPPTKRRAADSRGGADWRSEIWGLFGKNRDAYVAKDVLSDDEDMEADADALAREEFRSAQAAKREDEAALAEEKRHEEEKRRKRKQREMHH